MKRAIIHSVLIALLFSACSSPRKACRRAEGMIQRAVRICPEVAQLHTDTVVITVPGDSVAIAAIYQEADPDSLRAVISQLNEALVAERQVSAIDLVAAKKNTARAVQRVQKHVCYFPPTTINGETAHGIMYVDATGTPHGKCFCKPRKGLGVYTGQQIIAGPVQVNAGSNGWLIALAALGWLLAVVFLFFFISERALRLREKTART